MNPERFAHPLRLPTRRRHPSAILVNGRRVSDSTVDFDAIPISAVERIEILSDSAAALHGGHAIGGAINIVLRRDHEGAEVQASLERPTGAGGDAEHGSVLWGGAIGDGHMVIGADVFRRQEIRNADRDYSRASWTPGGSFADAAGVSVGGNTLLIPTRRYDEDGNIVEEYVRDATRNAIARPLGDCMGRAYTGVLADPYNLPGTGCGVAYDEIAWSTERREQESLFLDLGHPLGEDVDLYAGVWFAQSDVVSPRYAPSVGEFSFTPSRELRDKFLDDPDIVGLPDKLTVVHRFVGHGNRDLSGMDLIGGALNVGDRGPSTDPTFPGTSGADATLDSIRGRTLFLTAKVSFDP